MEVQTSGSKSIIEKYELFDEEKKAYQLDLSYVEKIIYFELYFKSDILKEKYFINLDLDILKKS